MTQYAGNPANNPPNFSLVDDTSPPTAAYVNPALEALGDRTAYNSAAVTALTAIVAQKVDGVNGGSYTPSAPIKLRLDDLQLIDPATGSVIVGPYGSGATEGYFNVRKLIASSISIPFAGTFNGNISFRNAYQNNVSTVLTGTPNYVIDPTLIDFYTNLDPSATSVNISPITAFQPPIGSVLTITTVSTTGGLLIEDNGRSLCTIPSGAAGWVELLYMTNAAGGVSPRWCVRSWSSGVTGVQLV